jgi:dTDP-4-amino-4,6-dideoxygalactose transaminase
MHLKWLINIKPDDEVIMPSYTFVSTANAFVLRGAKIKFVDIRPDTMNINEKLIEKAINKKTKAIVPVHYAGVSCEMDEILNIARQNNLFVIEDAAQGVMSTYKGQYLGSIGDFGAYSFHETKNYHSGEGGAILINRNEYIENAEIIREKGTNRSRFFRGQVDKYTWVNLGSSYLPSELNIAYLLPQLKIASEINQKRLSLWKAYFDNLIDLMKAGHLELPFIPNNITHYAHMFYIKLENLETRSKLIEFLNKNNIQSSFHYVPLHSSEAGIKFGEFIGEDKFTTRESDRLLRLPLYYDLKEEEVMFICESINRFFKGIK